MKINHLPAKKKLRTILLVQLLCAMGMTNAYAAAQYDFSAVAPNGQTLYYKITNTSTRTVMLTHPYNSNTNPWNSGSANGFAKPTGNLIIPYYVEYNGNSYSVTAIDSYTFGTNVINSYDIYYQPCNEITSVVIPSSVLTIGKSAFQFCTGLTSVTIPTSISSIGSQVFYQCTNLSTVYFNATNCGSVGADTWYNCTSLRTLNLGNTVTRIPTNGFQGATRIASITITKKVQTIGDYAFNGCINLTNVTVANNSVLNSIGQYAFQNCSNLASINLPNTLTSIGNYAFDGCSLLQSTSASQLLPNALESIGDYAFQNATTLAYIRIPNTVMSIGGYAFKGCIGLTTVDYEATNCTTSGTQALPPFYGCSALATVRVSDNVTRIPAYCFKDCTPLVNLTLPNGLEEIGTYAFYCCMNISSLILPASITNIGSFAFGNAYDMEIAHVESRNAIPPTIGEEAVFPAVQTIYVPMSSIGDYETTEYWEDYFFEGVAYRSIPGYGTSNDKWVFIASPLATNGGVNPTVVDDLTAGEFDLYRLNEGTTNIGYEWENYKNPTHTNGFKLVNGQGYLYANQDDIDLVFFDDLNTDTEMEVELSYTPSSKIAGINLVGNPFPVNAYSSRPYYVMNADGNAVIATPISTNEPIAPCTGVIVKAEENEINPTVTFNTTAPVTSNKGNISIMLNQQVNRGSVTIDNAIVSFNEGDQLGKYVFKADNAKVYIPKNGKDHAIVVASCESEMPVNFKATQNGEYTITVIPNDVKMNYLHLIDNLTGTDVDLLQNPSYTFSAKNDDYSSRFRLVIKANGIDENKTNDDFAFFNGSEWVVTNANNATIQIIDMMGRVVVSLEKGTNTISTDDVASGTYVLRLFDGENVKTQKIIIK